MAALREDALRLFFAILLPPALREELAELQGRLRRCGVKVKWVEPENLHLTLKFLGEAPAGVVERLGEVAAQVAGTVEPFTLHLRGVGAFPNLRRPRTVWVATGEGAKALAALGTGLDRALAEASLAEGEQRPFAGHCTIGRVREERNLAGLTAVLHNELEFEAGQMRCDALHLMRSELTRSGPVYAIQAAFALGNAAGSQRVGTSGVSPEGQPD